MRKQSSVVIRWHSEREHGRGSDFQIFPYLCGEEIEFSRISGSKVT